MHQLKPFADQRSLKIDKSGDIAAWTCQARDESAADRIGFPARFEPLSFKRFPISP